jgi:hypothetical protein
MGYKKQPMGLFASGFFMIYKKNGESNVVLNKQKHNNYLNIVGDSGMHNKSRSDMIDMGLSAQGLP